jgi:RNA polymerase sigma-70 factor (ECF subfamily)
MGNHARAVTRDLEVAAPTISSPVSFEEFFHLERDRLFGLMVLVTGDREEAEEIAQEAFLRLWERWEDVGAIERPGAYLAETAMNVFRKRQRRAAALRRLLPKLATPDRVGAAEAGVMLSDALRSLTPRQRAALVLTELVGYSAEEAGRVLHVRPSTIGALKYQGRAALNKGRSEDADD